jgi:type II secretory pathway component PulK
MVLLDLVTGLLIVPRARMLWQSQLIFQTQKVKEIYWQAGYIVLYACTLARTQVRADIMSCNKMLEHQETRPAAIRPVECVLCPAGILAGVFGRNASLPENQMVMAI